MRRSKGIEGIPTPPPLFQGTVHSYAWHAGPPPPNLPAFFLGPHLRFRA